MDELKFIQSLLKNLNIKRKMLFDVGAHFGTFSQPFAREGWQVHAFEPDPENRAKFEVWAHQFSGIQISSNAVADKPQMGAKFFKSHESTGISSLNSFTENHFEGSLVDVITLADYCLKNSIEDIDLLKIDTEGHDLFVLKGFPWKKIRPKVIMSEFENKKTISLGYCYEDMGHYLMNQGYSVFVSEWKPIVRYGIEHDWNRCFMYPGSLETENAWGNFIALRNDFNPNLFWYSIVDYLSFQGQVPLYEEKKNQFRDEERGKRDDLNLSREEMIVLLNDKMAEVQRILGVLENQVQMGNQEQQDLGAIDSGRIGIYQDQQASKHIQRSQCNDSSLVNCLISHFPKIYDLLPYKILKWFLQGLCLDVGAAAGFTTKQILSANPECKVIAFEPFKGNWPHLKNVLGEVHGWKLVAKAVSNFSGKGGFYVSSRVVGTEENWQGLAGYSSIGHLVPLEEVENYNSCDASIVDVCRIDDYVSDPVLFMKMDVQGAEFEVLQGANQTIKDYGISIIYIEFSGDLKVLEHIRDLGYVIFDTKYLLIPQVGNVVPETFGMLEYEHLHLSTGKIAMEGFIPSRPPDFLGLCDFMKKIQKEVGFFQTDLFCVHSSFLPAFLDGLSRAYMSVECSTPFIVGSRQRPHF